MRKESQEKFHCGVKGDQHLILLENEHLRYFLFFVISMDQKRIKLPLQPKLNKKTQGSKLKKSLRRLLATN